jgi:hypothetical protein
LPQLPVKTQVPAIGFYEQVRFIAPSFAPIKLNSSRYGFFYEGSVGSFVFIRQAQQFIQERRFGQYDMLFL